MSDLLGKQSGYTGAQASTHQESRLQQQGQGETACMPVQRVAYILTMYPRFSETFILSELLELERQGVEIQIFSLKQPNDGMAHADVGRVRAPVAYVPESFRRAPRAFLRTHAQVLRREAIRYLWSLGKALKKRRRSSLKHFLQAGHIAPHLHTAGITHAHAHFASSATSVALHLHQLAGTSYSFTAHAKDIYTDTVEPRDLVRKMRSARFVVTVSGYNRRYLGSLDGVADRIVRIYNGLDLRQFTPNDRVLQDPPLILAVGRLVEKKGFADLVRACAALRRDEHRFQCKIVGTAQLEGALRALIDEFDLAEHVQLVGPLPRETLLDLYPRASVVVAPCIVAANGNRDGLPTVLIEAMAFGVPVVSTDVTGIPELVEDERTGLLAPQGDPEALARAVRRLIEDRDAAEALARAGRERVEREFDLAVNVAQLHRLFQGTASSEESVVVPQVARV